MEREVVMLEAQEARTVAVKACAACDGGLLEYDKFCRWCGSCQLDSASGLKAKDSELKDLELINIASISRASNHLISGNMASRGRASEGLSRYRTCALDQSGALPYRRVSGPLVDAVVAGVAAHSTGEQTQFMKRAILALISIPIWLIIVLLSPLDAYAAAKNILR